MAAPNHLFSICPVNLCPAEEPYPAPAITVPDPVLDSSPESHVGGGVQVRVIDTGLVAAEQMPGYQAAHPWLYSEPEPEPFDASRNRPIEVSTGLIREYAGHGTFITGLLKRVAPAAVVTVSSRLQMAGAIMEDDLANALLEALDDQPDIISLSAGGATFDGNPPRCFDAMKDKLEKNNRTLLVAAAGNNGSATEKFWPAAYATELPGKVLAVGALRQDRTGRACFSNYGDWVSVYAPGERLANAFVWGDYRYFDPPSLSCRYYPVHPLYCPCTCVTAPPQHAQVYFEGMCRWSGTSFATPIVAGAVAAFITEQRNAQQAATEFRAGGSQTKQITDIDPVKPPQLTVLNLH
jgi:subtilisin family serine protease